MRIRTRRLGRFDSWWWDVALISAFVLITYLVARGVTADLDLGVRRWIGEHQATWAHRLALGLNYFGQGLVVTWLITGSLTLILLRRTRSWTAVLPFVTGFLATYVTIGPLKLWTDRAAPSDPRPDAVELFNTFGPDNNAYSVSYPSGHVVNAIVWWGVIVILASALRPLSPTLVRWLRIAPPVIVLCTTTYLSHHWLTDGLAAVAVGLVVTRLIARIDWSAVLVRKGTFLYTDR